MTLTNQAEMTDFIKNIEKALAQKGRPIAEFFKEFEKKHGMEEPKV